MYILSKESEKQIRTLEVHNLETYPRRSGTPICLPALSLGFSHAPEVLADGWKVIAGLVIETQQTLGCATA